MEGHEVSSRRVNIAAPEKQPVWRYFGRCSCGHETYVKFSTAALAEGAVRQIHVRDLVIGTTTGASA